ncbi:MULTISPECIES: DNA cytosine methyltransferase [unclassified Microcoleus]|uniref:DNA cytosine methyltransferase n=1 Tax=unclassified Microcoleus TaxID=2642155 RepID=UPI001E155598|nr:MULTISPECIES: DNA cytosine methyltransferase [unclassified Microcoleus]MCC3512263.1 DNA cytosine methyltransferase [Microcoleus sp. PH2017_17_BER_D_A]MCC3549824.1 DNA cytosine methyltransferase [Microcoleus sp. PH2017_24_DOB_U_A]
MLRSLSLFTGIGGFELAAAALGCFQVEQFVEIDEDAQYVLRQHYPRIPIHSDIRTFSATRGQYDCIWGGFPCTGTSNAGKRGGLAHPDSSLWWEMLRIILEARPSFVIIENPEGLLLRGGREVFASLTMAGYRVEEPLLLSAKEVGAGHQRNRVFIVAFLQDFAQQQYEHQFKTCGADQVRTIAQEAGRHFRIPLFIRNGDGVDIWIPPGLDKMPSISDFQVKSKTKGRIRARYVFAKTVMPGQAYVALKRVQYLAQAFGIID